MFLENLNGNVSFCTNMQESLNVNFDRMVIVILCLEKSLKSELGESVHTGLRTKMHIFFSVLSSSMVSKGVDFILN